MESPRANEPSVERQQSVLKDGDGLDSVRVERKSLFEKFKKKLKRGKVREQGKGGKH